MINCVRSGKSEKLSQMMKSEEMLTSLDTNANLVRHQQSPTSSSRILDIPCKVCGDNSSGKHYNIFACDGCAGFFKRSIRRSRQYVCKAKVENTCTIDKNSRNQCRACRLRKCEEAGMNKDAVQNERGPRTATLRKQALGPYYTEETNQILAATGSLTLAIQKATQEISSQMPQFVVPSPLDSAVTETIRKFQMGSNVPIHQLPSVLTTYHPSIVCEYAARLVFMNVEWAKSGQSFGSLRTHDQVVLIQESWKDLFVIGSAQLLTMINFPELLDYSGILKKHCSPTSFLNTVTEFRLILENIRQLRLDQFEYTCIRAIVLYRTKLDKSGASSNATFLYEAPRIEAMQEEVHASLRVYLERVYPADRFRYSQLMMLISSFNKVPSETIEELFFRASIGRDSISRIIVELYNKR